MEILLIVTRFWKMELCTGAGRPRASVELAALLSHDGGPSPPMGFDVCCWYFSDLTGRLTIAVLKDKADCTVVRLNFRF